MWTLLLTERLHIQNCFSLLTITRWDLNCRWLLVARVVRGIRGSSSETLCVVGAGSEPLIFRTAQG